MQLWHQIKLFYKLRKLGILSRKMNLSKSEQTWEGTNISESTWVDFIESDVWRAFLFEFEDREKYLTQLFKDADMVWSPDVIRGKMTELDFVRQLPTLIILSIRDKDKNQKEISDGKDS